MTKLKNSNYEKKSKTWIVKKHKKVDYKKININLNCDKLKNLIYDIPKTQIMTKLKKLKLTTQKLKLWQNSKTQIVREKKSPKLENSNWDKTQKLELWQNSKIQIVTKLNNSNCDKTKKSNCDKTKKNQIVTKL